MREGDNDPDGKRYPGLRLRAALDVRLLGFAGAKEQDERREQQRHCRQEYERIGERHRSLRNNLWAEKNRCRMLLRLHCKAREA
jgi:hypothetical protein